MARDRRKRWRLKHPDKARASAKKSFSKWYSKNKQICLKRCAAWKKKNPEKKKLWDKRYRESNSEKISEYKKNWKKRHLARVNANARRRSYERRKSDVNYRILRNLRSRLWGAFSTGEHKKAYGTMRLIGCTIQNFKNHLESRFSSGMNWGNYGHNGWHIDHIIPCCQFDLSVPEQQINCFHYSNLQPLWASDNFRKTRK